MMIMKSLSLSLSLHFSLSSFAMSTIRQKVKRAYPSHVGEVAQSVISSRLHRSNDANDMQQN